MAIKRVKIRARTKEINILQNLFSVCAMRDVRTDIRFMKIADDVAK